MDIKSVKNQIKKIPISSVLEAWAPTTLEGICCFHEDNSPGAFQYKDREKDGGIFKCFCCGKGGNGLKFVMEHDGVDRKEASLRIATRFGIITEDEYKKESDTPTPQERTVVKIKQPKKVNEATRKNEEELDRVYRLLKEYSGLNQKHRQYLLDRGVHEEDLNNYFSLSRINGLFFLKLHDNKLSREDVIGVPGFYLENGVLTSRDIEGIAIPMHNAEGLITAIQVRKDEVKKKEARYVFFSSTGFEGGCSCGAQVDIIEPNKNGSIFITEGHFKAKELNRHFKTTTISVQGVNNTKQIDIEIPKLLKKRKIKRFIIAFDADMVHNKSVKKAALQLQKQLEKFDIPAGFMVWDEKFGKGADDVILSGNAKEFKFTRMLKEE